MKSKRGPLVCMTKRFPSILWTPTFAILRACYRAQKPQRSRKYEKNTNSPTLGWPPKNQKKTPKKYQNSTKTAIFVPFWYFFVIFFGFFGGQPGVGDFVFFSYFRDSGVLGLSSRPAGSQPNLHPAPHEFTAIFCAFFL